MEGCRSVKFNTTPVSPPLPPSCCLSNFWYSAITATSPRIDAKLGVGMVGGVKAPYAVLPTLVLGVECGDSMEQAAPKTQAKAKATPKIEAKKPGPLEAVPNKPLTIGISTFIV